MPATYDADLVFVDRSCDRAGHPLAFRDLIIERDLGALWNEDPGIWRWRYQGCPEKPCEERGTVQSREAAMIALADAHRHSSLEASDRVRQQYQHRLNSPEGTYPVI